MSRPRTASSYSGQSYYPQQRLRGIAEAEYDAAAAFGEPALSDASSDEQMARAMSESKWSARLDAQHRSPAISRSHSYSSSSSSTLLGSRSGSKRSSVSDASSFTSSQGYYSPAATPRYGVDETISRDLARSMSVASIQSELLKNPQYTRPAPSQTSQYGADESAAQDLARSWRVASAQSDSVSNTLAEARAPGSSRFPTPTPRYAADETIARNLSRDWDAASVQSEIERNPQYLRSGPPLVVRSPSPSTLSISSASSQRTAYANQSPTPSRPLSPLLLPTRLRTPSIRSMTSNSSMRSASSARSMATTSSKASMSSLLSSVTRSARHASLIDAAEAFRAAIPASLSRSSSSASFAPRGSNSRASSVRSGSSSRTARGTPTLSSSDTEALGRLHALAIGPVRCANPGCGTLIRPTALDNIIFSPFLPHNTDSKMPLPGALLAALHARCPVCTTSHCRGCGLPSGCGRSGSHCEKNGPLHPYSPSPTSMRMRTASSSSNSPPSSGYNTIYAPAPCSVPTHCSASRALGVLASLVAFDRELQGAHQQSPGRAADKPLIGSLHALVYFIEAPRHRPHRGSVGQDVDEDEPQEAHPALGPLLGLSRVPGYIAALLRAGLRGGVGSGGVDVGTWMGRAPAYGAVLRVLRAVGDDTRGCRRVLAQPIRVAPVPGVEGWLRSGNAVPSRRVGESVVGEMETLLALVRRLEPARLELLRLADASQFGPTVETAHALCDGVMYLLLQDALGLLEVE
ncbi:hypothetical protein C8R45DRAFT_1105320 [Mycena sanguinolenta]|nr:hypothetical protein C8R45DRAFT_1105320 [Mycena sanguinolenta]